MRTFAALALLGAVTAVMTENDFEFVQFIAKHNKNYKSIEEYKHR